MATTRGCQIPRFTHAELGLGRPNCTRAGHWDGMACKGYATLESHSLLYFRCSQTVECGLFSGTLYSTVYGLSGNVEKAYQVRQLLHWIDENAEAN